MGESAIDREMRKLKAMGVTISTTPARGHEAGFADRPMGIIQAAAERHGIAEAPKLTPAELAEVQRFGLDREDA